MTCLHVHRPNFQITTYYQVFSFEIQGDIFTRKQVKISAGFHRNSTLNYIFTVKFENPHPGVKFKSLNLIGKNKDV